MSYKTQKQAAKKGIITKYMREVMEEEKISESLLLKRIVDGSIIIPANKNHINLIAKGIGKGLSTKINVNLGVSEDCCNVDLELEKVRKSLDLETDSIMDLSSYGETQEFRRRLLEISPVMVGTVPVYDVAAQNRERIGDITVDDFFNIVEKHAQDGVDFMTIHAGITKAAVECLKRNPRLTYIVSRGGSILLQWMKENGKENPFYAYFERLLEICQRYDVTLSLGDSLRPGSLKDATDASQIQELIILGELAKQAWEADVQVMIEGPGHIPIQEIAANVQLEKKLCHGAPFYVLGPVVTDIAPGYDHITSAIGGAIAASYGADFLCYVTPAEHLRLPDLNDIKEGVIAAKIAAHSADIAKDVHNATQRDNEISAARKNFDWEKIFSLALDATKARQYRNSSQPLDKEVCTMCANLCAIKKSKGILFTE